MKIGILTLGCKVNQYESNAIKQELLQQGYEVTEKLEKADLYILNTCAVTNEAEKKSRTYLAKFKKLNNNAKVIVCGCASENNENQFLNHDNVSYVIGNAGKSKIVSTLNAVGNLKQELPTIYENYNSLTTSKTRAYLKIQDGCNNFCSYCLIPYVRGRSRSRDLNEILFEAGELSKNNKEIILTGINISDYKIDGKLALQILMEKLSKNSSRIRIGSLEVNVITEEFLKTLKAMPNFCPQFHLSMQSGCDRILKLMNRHYSVEQYLGKIELIRQYFPDSSITTDVIVGFPTETKQDFLETLETIKKAKFMFMHIFPYSIRKGTVAEKMTKVDGNVVLDRVKRITMLNEELNKKFLTNQIGKTGIVLTEIVEENFMVGHTENYIKVFLPKTTERHALIKVEYTSIFKDGMKAKIV